MVLLSEGYLWFTAMSHSINHKNVHIFHGLLVFSIILVLSILYRLSLKSVEAELVPEKGVTVKNIFQMGVESLANLIKGVIPHHSEDYVPLLAAIFFYLFISNLMGVLPGILPPTENINTNLAVAITVFGYYHFVGIKRQGFKSYMAHFFGPGLGDSFGMQLMRFGFIAPLMFVIEIISHCVRPVSLSLRLFGNINGDHLVLKTFQDLAPMWLPVPVIFLAFGIFVAFIQAFVFTLLSTIYVGLAVETHGDHH